ncbi:MAG: FtsW/RodA/SpoVE family cell cycle protein [Nitrospiraceae bacterium]|nr:FtsW/RodA/SpoVE family cell cycle protein [Nitrospiraceae bacterium]
MTRITGPTPDSALSRPLAGRGPFPSGAMDGALAILVFLLMMLGVALVMSARLSLNSPYQLFTRQILSTAIALVVMFAVSRIDYHVWVKRRIPLWVGGLAGLLLLMVPHVGVVLNGARRWVHLGFMTLQPSELARVVLVILMASLLARERSEQKVLDNRPFALRLPKTLGFALLMLPYLAIILHEPDFGSDLFIVIVIGAMLFLAGVSFRQLALLILLLAVSATLFLIHHSYALARFHNFSQTHRPASLLGTQLGQSLVAIGSGGLWGQGLGHDWIGGGVLPEPGTDFIFALVGEELGFFWSVAVVAVYGGIFYLGMRAAARSPDFLGRILVQGLTLSVVLEAIMNLGVVTGVFPTKGIPLPFMSFGGSSLLANAWGIGIILSVSRYQARSGEEGQKMEEEA